MKRLVLIFMVLTTALAGCTSLPTSGEPELIARPASLDGGVVLDPQGPTPGSSPENLVTDFLRASGAGLSGDFSVARQFLTKEAAARWNPTAELRVYEDTQTPSISQTRNGAIRVSARAAGTLDGGGRYSVATPEAIINVEFSLVKNEDGEWRIATLDDGLVIPNSIFSSLYSETLLYFLTADRAALVPEVRWYLNSGQATYAINGLLEGPSTWLAIGAHSAIPPETTLTSRGVSINDGVARVDFSSDVASMRSTDLIALEAQVSKTLMNVPGVQSVVLTSEGAEMSIPSKVDLSAYPYATYTLAALRDGVPAQVSGGEVTQIDPELVDGLGLTSIAPAYSDPLTVAAALGNDGASIYAVSYVGNPTAELLKGSQLVEPSIDAHDWVWSGERVSQGEVLAVHLETGERATFQLPWLGGLTVRDIAVSREGARMVILTEQSGDVQMNAVSIARDATGTPIEIGDPVRFGQSLVEVTDVSWVSEVRLAAIARNPGSSTSSIHIVGLGTSSVSLAAVDGLVSLSSGRGIDSIVIENSQHTLFSYDGAGWRLVSDSLTSPAYPG